MNASWEKTEKNLGVLHIEVEETQVAKALDQAFKKVAQKVNVPGFRKGKVPRQIFEAKFGVESLYQDALDIILPEAYGEAVKETGIEPIDRPEVDVDEFEKGKPFKFTAKVQVKPEVELGEYKGIEVPEKSFDVSDEDVDSELKSMQERHAELIVVDEGAAENGDTVSIDFEGFVNDVAFEGGQAENYSLELGSGSFIPGFEEQVVGLKKGEEKDVNVTFPEEYQSEDLAGKPAVFKVKLQEIKRKNLPELDDEFAKDVSEFETLDEYKADIRKNLVEKKDKEKEQYIEGTVIEKVSEAAEVEIPEAMVETEVNQMLQEFTNRLRTQGMTIDMYYQYSGQDEAALKEQMKDDAGKRVRNNLVLTAITEAENISVSDEELDEELEEMAKMYQQPAAEIRKILETNDSIGDIKKDLANRKTVKWLVEQSKTVSEVA